MGTIMEINLTPLFVYAGVIAIAGAALFIFAEFVLDFWRRLNLVFKVVTLAVVVTVAAIILSSQM